jgi:hypothetical protein
LHAWYQQPVVSYGFAHVNRTTFHGRLKQFLQKYWVLVLMLIPKELDPGKKPRTQYSWSAMSAGTLLDSV